MKVCPVILVEEAPMNHHNPLALVDQTSIIDGYSYRVSTKAVLGGVRAQLVWIGIPKDRQRPPDETICTPTLRNARAAILEAHALALEYVLAWRPPGPAS